MSYENLYCIDFPNYIHIHTLIKVADMEIFYNRGRGTMPPPDDISYQIKGPMTGVGYFFPCCLAGLMNSQTKNKQKIVAMFLIPF